MMVTLLFLSSLFTIFTTDVVSSAAAATAGPPGLQDPPGPARAAPPPPPLHAGSDPDTLLRVPAHVVARAAQRTQGLIPLAPLEPDRGDRGELPGVAPPNLKFLGMWTANDYPSYPVRFLNLGLQDAYQFLGVDGNDSSKILDMANLRQAMSSSEAGQSVLIRVEHVFFGQSMPYDHLCGEEKPGWQGGCRHPGDGSGRGNGTLSNWETRWLTLRSALAPYIDNGTIAGVQMGDELLGQCLSLRNLTSAVELIRSTWPGALIYVNEAIGPTVWNRNYCNRTVRNAFHGPVGADDPPELGPWHFPPEVDLVGVDMQGCTYVPGICARYNVSAATARDPTACPNESIWFNDCYNEKEQSADDCGVPQRCVKLLQMWHNE
jgi:hypothetical protein